MKKILFTMLALCLVGLGACEKESEFLNKVNPNEVTVTTFFKNSTDAVAAVNGVYGPLQSGHLYHNSYYNLFDVGIELSPTSNIPSAWHTSTYSYTSTQETIREVWIGLYQIIGRANFAIVGIEKMEAGKIDETLRNRLMAEARFLRGWAYFELGFNWGRVPLTLSVPTTAATSNQPRSQTEKEIYDQAIRDFEFAAANLPVSYPASDVGRITRGAAVGYLGKIYLYMASPGVNLAPDGYSKAEEYFKRLIEGSEFSYNLVPEYMDNFTWFKENNEVRYLRWKFLWFQQPRQQGCSRGYEPLPVMGVPDVVQRHDAAFFRFPLSRYRSPFTVYCLRTTHPCPP
jgi:hypothetical protein